MRVFSVLYYTNNIQEYNKFTSDSQVGLNTAANKATEVTLLESFKDGIPLFPNISALSKYLENYNQNLSDLAIIIDSSLIVRSNSSKLLRAIMIEYPEVKFLFEGNQLPKDVIFSGEEMVLEDLPLEECETCLKLLSSSIDNSSNSLNQEFYSNLLNLHEKDWENLRFALSISLDESVNEAELLKRIRDVKPQLLRTCAKMRVEDSLLRLPNKDSNFYINIVHTRDNLFDASNVRYALKQWKYANLRVNSRNFEVIQTSRRDHLAFCVEEEKGQNRFNSYCLYANGFRVLPITSATELLNLNNVVNIIKPSIIVRDYDLQFFDQNENHESINKIRGFRDNPNQTWTIHLFESPFWKNYYTNDANYQIIFTTGTYRNLQKDSSIELGNAAQIKSNINSATPIYFVSKGTDKVQLAQPLSFIEIDENNHTLLKRIVFQFIDEHKELKLVLPGIQKPVSGVYCPFQNIPEIKMRYRYICQDAKMVMDTTREGHNHGTALDVYATVRSLLRRAEKYYEMGKFIHAAVLAHEIIEYLNGFHESILLQAYQLLAISENALAMNTVGGDENALKEDTLFRINKIEYEIDKILRRQKDGSNGDRRDFKYNVLNQIFSSCRKFCKDKEHFSAEDCFISAMAHVNEGFTPCDIWHELKVKMKTIKNSLKTKKNELNTVDYE